MQTKIKFLQGLFGNARLQNNKIELMVPCPFCKDPKKLKMNIRLDSDLWHCWVCNNKGRSLPRLIKQKNPGKLAEYFDKFGKNFTYNNYTQLSSSIIPVSLPEGFKLLMLNLSDPDAKPIYRYAVERGLTDDMLWRYRVGYSSEWMHRRRLIIPSFNEEGELNYWTGRTIDEDCPYKYINAKADKKEVIFNDIDIDWSKPIYLVEGPLDLVKCINVNSTCLLGSSLSERSMLFYKLAMFAEEIVLCLDRDAIKKQDTIADKLLQYDKHVSWVDPPKDGLDWGDMSHHDVSAAFATTSKYDRNTKLNRLISML